jgi:hypothetical protein
VGLNPYTQPFAYIKLNGQLKLYAKRDCADQLRRLRGISIEIVDKKLSDGLLSIHVRARDKDGRTDEDYGIVAVGSAAGEALANLGMKAVTKAKRRVTLSISGLGMLDETEVFTVPGVELVEVDDAGEVRTVAPAQPPPRKRKSSAASKKDGSDERHKVLTKHLAAITDRKDCEAWWVNHSEELANMARGWFDLLAEDYFFKMQEFGVEMVIDDHGWPVVVKQEAAA